MSDDEFECGDCSDCGQRVVGVLCVLVCVIVMLAVVPCIIVGMVYFIKFLSDNGIRVIVLSNNTEWQNRSISNVSMLESVALSPFECHKIDAYFFHFFPSFLEVKAPKHTGINLILQGENTTDSQIIDECFAHANQTCSISIGGYNEIYAFVNLDSANSTDDDVVQWSCSYLNVSLLVIMSILAFCGCIGMLCCLSACICLMVKRFRDSSEINHTSESYQTLTYKSQKWKLPTLSKMAETQPLLKSDYTAEEVCQFPKGLLLN